MSNVVAEKKKRSRKTKVQEAVPEPISVKAEVEAQQVEATPEKVAEPVVEEIKADDDTKAEDRGQKKKVFYEELKADLEELQNRLLEDLSVAKAQKNKEITSILKSYDKLLKKIRSNVKKIEPKEKKSVTRTHPSGFNKPLPISEEIATFAGWDPSELRSRTDVTVMLCDYVREKGLQMEGNKRVIVPDDKLAKVLRYDENSEPPLTYSTMQKYIGNLFKAVPVA